MALGKVCWRRSDLPCIGITFPVTRFTWRWPAGMPLSRSEWPMLVFMPDPPERTSSPNMWPMCWTMRCRGSTSNAWKGYSLRLNSVTLLILQFKLILCSWCIMMKKVKCIKESNSLVLLHVHIMALCVLLHMWNNDNCTFYIHLFKKVALHFCSYLTLIISTHVFSCVFTL